MTFRGLKNREGWIISIWLSIATILLFRGIVALPVIPAILAMILIGLPMILATASWIASGEISLETESNPDDDV